VPSHSIGQLLETTSGAPAGCWLLPKLETNVLPFAAGWAVTTRPGWTLQMARRDGRDIEECRHAVAQSSDPSPIATRSRVLRPAYFISAATCVVSAVLCTLHMFPLHAVFHVVVCTLRGAWLNSSRQLLSGSRWITVLKAVLDHETFISVRSCCTAQCCTKPHPSGDNIL
jgi:hypothetical protein